MVAEDGFALWDPTREDGFALWDPTREDGFALWDPTREDGFTLWDPTREVTVSPFGTPLERLTGRGQRVGTCVKGVKENFDFGL
ncbi:hypothetical protein NDU88_000794 [Pleurodeles waltl]|uniref:Uncharacterized protein n=1 Tax=Pleurodeles waltl TaxID=8319 RepID=A0AAV7SXN0_PLEWA|nr:hypothetical protein NDU88_000794 [Pleurodeles waltl]